MMGLAGVLSHKALMNSFNCLHGKPCQTLPALHTDPHCRVDTYLSHLEWWVQIIQFEFIRGVKPPITVVSPAHWWGVCSRIWGWTCSLNLNSPFTQLKREWWWFYCSLWCGHAIKTVSNSLGVSLCSQRIGVHLNNNGSETWLSTQDKNIYNLSLNSYDSSNNGRLMFKCDLQRQVCRSYIST